MVLHSRTVLGWRCCRIRVAAAAVVAAALALAFTSRCSTAHSVLSMYLLISLSIFLSIFSHLSLRQLWWLHAPFSFGLVAVRNAVLSLVLTHHACLHHVMCLFDTSLCSLIRFCSFLFSSTHSSCALLSSSSSPCAFLHSCSSRSHCALALLSCLSRASGTSFSSSLTSLTCFSLTHLNVDASN